MMESIGVSNEISIPTAIFLLIVARIYFGDVIFSVKYAGLWNVIRRILYPIVSSQFEKRFGIDVPEKVYEEEYVATSSMDWHSIAMKLDQMKYFEVPLLAGKKTDWKGREEVGTMVTYHGPKPFPGAPNWLRERQLHMTFFRSSNGDTVITAHEEANSWRPDYWIQHILKSANVSRGVNMAKSLVEEHDGIETYD